MRHYEHMGISITNPKPADVSRLVPYGRWVRAGFEECWNLPDLQAFTVEAHRQGLKVLACVQPCKPRYKSWDAGRYKTFATFATKVADLGVDAIEAGNELNNKMFNDGDLAQCAATAVTLARAVVDAVQAKHPSTPVIANGWSPAGAGPAPLYPQNALKATIAGASGVDGYGYHPYEMSMLPSLYSTNPGWNACGHLRDAQAQLAAAPVWLTEYGFHGTDANQAKWVRDYFVAFTAHRAAGVNITHAFLHTLYEGSSTVSEAERTMGILRGSGSTWTEKPAGAVLREIAARPW